MSGLRKTPIHRALYRPKLILGGERPLMIMLFFVAAALMVLAMNLYAFIIGSVLLFGGVYGFRQMAKADPFMFSVWYRQLSYREFYRAFSRPYRVGDKSLNSKGY
ncbi:MAG: conjugal transfer protein TrbD [Devosia sp.]